MTSPRYASLLRAPLARAAAVVAALAAGSGGGARWAHAEDPAPAAVQAPSTLPDLSAATYAALSDALRPSAAEQAWREVGWRPSFAQAVLEARAAGKPVFLWAMNGHPLACT